MSDGRPVALELRYMEEYLPVWGQRWCPSRDAQGSAEMVENSFRIDGTTSDDDSESNDSEDETTMPQQPLLPNPPPAPSLVLSHPVSTPRRGGSVARTVAVRLPGPYSGGASGRSSHRILEVQEPESRFPYQLDSPLPFHENNPIQSTSPVYDSNFLYPTYMQYNNTRHLSPSVSSASSSSLSTPYSAIPPSEFPSRNSSPAYSHITPPTWGTSPTRSPGHSAHETSPANRQVYDNPNLWPSPIDNDDRIFAFEASQYFVGAPQLFSGPEMPSSHFGQLSFAGELPPDPLLFAPHPVIPPYNHSPALYGYDSTRYIFNSHQYQNSLQSPGLPQSLADQSTSQGNAFAPRWSTRLLPSDDSFPPFNYPQPQH